MAEPIPISSLEHFEYCPRQCALILVDGIWVENRHTVRGQRFHRRADTPSVSKVRGTVVVRAVEVWSDRLGLIGRVDAIEATGDRLVPIEYKAGTRHSLTADVQVCAQALCLEEMLDIEIEEGAIWYGQHRRRAAVELDHQLRQRTESTIREIHALRVAETLPRANFDGRCTECQLLPICLPERTSGSSSQASTYVRTLFANTRGEQ